ncbi:MAG: hypothetical protein LBP38_08705 [Desulfovibrio sp.]|jgi:hypothetical protein|nr:hypothetical protein [Desulfovibrio sp.]
MKISNEQLQAVQEVRTQRPAMQRTETGFDRILTREMDNVPAQGAAVSGRADLHIPPQILPELEAGKVGGTGAALPAFSKEAADMVDDVLTELEGYAAQLGRAEGADLRTAFASLQNMQEGIGGFRERFPGESAGTARELIEELDVLAVTETFKFNRGDYL